MTSLIPFKYSTVLSRILCIIFKLGQVLIFFLCNFKEIMDVEHLWFSSSTRPQEKDMELTMEETISPEENMVQTLTNMADKRLFKLVKWCKSLPLFKNILVSRDY